MMDQASNLLGQVNALFADREKQLEKAECNLKQRTEALQKEKEMMAKVPVADSDILTLNVGGSIVVTKRATLIQAEGSALAARFSGNWEQCLDHDDQGHIFLDLDPDLFKHILFYLRSRTMLSGPEDKVPFPQVGQDKLHAFRNLIRYLALEEYMGCGSCTALRFVAAHPTVDLQGQVAAVQGDSTYFRSISVGPLGGEIWYMKCKIHALKDWMFFGIAADLDVTANATSHHHYAHQSSFGWAPKSQFCCGNQCKGSILFKAGDCVLLKADFLNNKLSLCTEAPTVQHAEMALTLAPAQRNRTFFHVILYKLGDKVELLPVTPEDQALLP